MTKHKPTKRYRRRVIYLVTGIVIGIAVMILPWLVHSMMGPVSPFLQELTNPEILSTQMIISPFDAVYEFIWLALPAIFVILVLYWVAGRRTRWSGYDEAVKWSRR
ncbi:MAG: hypothetical protein ACFFCH_08400 [Promethearchaeota archaeon]